LIPDNTRVTVRHELKGVALNVTGVDDPWGGYTDFDRALWMGDPSALTTMPCHPPDLHPALVVERQIDLTLAGNCHIGQVKL
jgi:predicted MPP superfamily phosphohydrolase